MFVLTAINVRDALPKAVQHLIRSGEEEETRIGTALVSPGPVTIHYLEPKQHVLVDPVRDANPFFHLVEAMWMLAGREDGAFLDRYIKDFSKNFGDEEGIIPDAYGFRWREYFGADQLPDVIQQLKENPSSRQVVLQMWDTPDLTAEKGKPCNLSVVFRVRRGKLNMMVPNRSNDVIWGCCGANAVHFPLLQEYVATMAGLQLGEYWQVSNNLHLYTDHYEKLRKRAGELNPKSAGLMYTPETYGKTQQLIDNQEHFMEDLFTTMDFIDDMHNDVEIYTGNMSNSFLRDTVIPMAMAHWMHKKGDKQRALGQIMEVVAPDWQRAGREWLERRDGK